MPARSSLAASLQRNEEVEEASLRKGRWGHLVQGEGGAAWAVRGGTRRAGEERAGGRRKVGAREEGAVGYEGRFLGRKGGERRGSLVKREAGSF